MKLRAMAFEEQNEIWRWSENSFGIKYRDSRVIFGDGLAEDLNLPKIKITPEHVAQAIENHLATDCL